MPPKRPGLRAWPDLSARCEVPELMDGPALDDPQLRDHVLRDLAAVNRLTRTHGPVLQFLRQAWARRPAGEPVSVLDVGCGQGDLLRAVWCLAWHAHRPVRLQGLDLHPGTLHSARRATPPGMAIEYVAGDVFGFEPPPTDCIVSSQVAHHLDDRQLIALLHWLDRHARDGWCLADLRRHWLPYLGFPWLARAAGWHPVVRIDGTRSIARACTDDEWQALLQRAGVPAQVRRHAPWRLTVSALKPRPA